MREWRLSRLSIETPEGVTFSFELATLVSRALAWAIDAGAIATAAYLAGKIAAGLNLLGRDVASALSVVLYFLISMVYGILLEWRWRGQTLGKRVMGLRVIDVQGLRLHLPQIAIRNLLRVVDMLPLLYLVGGATCAFTRNAQRLGDLAANTVVAKERQPVQPDLEQIAPAKYNSLLAWPHLAARLRAKVGPEDAAIAARAAALRDGYDPSERIELFRELAGHFRRMVEFPAEAVEGLTDEQYVRSVLRVVYGSGTHLGE
jgi:uncharacterized RDD family membrane protein YckC